MSTVAKTVQLSEATLLYAGLKGLFTEYPEHLTAEGLVAEVKRMLDTFTVRRTELQTITLALRQVYRRRGSSPASASYVVNGIQWDSVQSIAPGVCIQNTFTGISQWLSAAVLQWEYELVQADVPATDPVEQAKGTAAP